MTTFFLLRKEKILYSKKKSEMSCTQERKVEWKTKSEKKEGGEPFGDTNPSVFWGYKHFFTKKGLL